MINSFLLNSYNLRMSQSDNNFHNHRINNNNNNNNNKNFVITNESPKKSVNHKTQLIAHEKSIAIQSL